MSERPLGALRVLACDSRVQILRVLQERERSTPVEEVAREIGRHVNTTREHLDRLVASGFVTRESEQTKKRGRPRMLYSSVDSAAVAISGSRAREQLVDLLVEGYGKDYASPEAAAEEAGRAWASQLGCPGAAASEDETQDASAQIAALERHFAQLGFEPEVHREALEVHLLHCPFAGAAQRRTGVVCGAHLGLARGVLARHQGPLHAERLDPFCETGHCVLHLSLN